VMYLRRYHKDPRPWTKCFLTGDVPVAFAHGVTACFRAVTAVAHRTPAPVLCDTGYPLVRQCDLQVVADTLSGAQSPLWGGREATMKTPERPGGEDRHQQRTQSSGACVRRDAYIEISNPVDQQVTQRDVECSPEHING
jgi:hypothetical protein